MSNSSASLVFNLTVANDQQRRIVQKWLALAVASLLGAGVFSLLLVLSRTPGVQNIIPWVDFFHVALVVHVDLSVLIWFLSMAGVFWTVSNPSSGHLLDQWAWNFAVLGALMIVICPFMGVGNPLLNNYVPVLQDPVFYAALLVFGLGVLLLLFGRLKTIPGRIDDGASVLTWAAYLAAIPALLSMVALLISYIEIPTQYDGEYYFELLFWGGGPHPTVHSYATTAGCLVMVGQCLWRQIFNQTFNSRGFVSFGHFAGSNGTLVCMQPFR